jgi:hypothetical protein
MQLQKVDEQTGLSTHRFPVFIGGKEIKKITFLRKKDETSNFPSIMHNFV